MMNDLNEIETKTTAKILELQQAALGGKGSLSVVIAKNIKHWEMNLLPVCVAVGASYLDVVREILAACGYEVDKKKLSVYLSRAREKAKIGR